MVEEAAVLGLFVFFGFFVFVFFFTDNTEQLHNKTSVSVFNCENVTHKTLPLFCRSL